MRLLARLLDALFPEPPPALKLDRARVLLAAAVNSLNEFLASKDPQDVETLSYSRHKYEFLQALYGELEKANFNYRRPGFPFSRLPTARDLYWDIPSTPLQTRCLNDAEALSYYLRDHGPPAIDSDA